MIFALVVLALGAPDESLAPGFSNDFAPNFVPGSFGGPLFIPDDPLYSGIRPDSFVQPDPSTFVFLDKEVPKAPASLPAPPRSPITPPTAPPTTAAPTTTPAPPPTTTEALPTPETTVVTSTPETTATPVVVPQPPQPISVRPSYVVPSPVFVEENGPANYAFEYGVNDAVSGTNFGHSESRNGK